MREETVRLWLADGTWRRSVLNHVVGVLVLALTGLLLGKWIGSLADSYFGIPEEGGWLLVGGVGLILAFSLAPTLTNLITRTIRDLWRIY